MRIDMAAPVQTSFRDRFSQSVEQVFRRFAGVDYCKHEALLEPSQWQGSQHVTAYQDEHLLNLLRYAYDEVPFYRARIEAAFGGRPQAPLDRTAFAALALLSKDDLRAQGQGILSRPARGLFKGMTSGSTGVPIQVWHDAEYCSFVRAVRRRASLWYGVEPSWPAFIIGNPPYTFLGRVRLRLINALINRRLAAPYDLSIPAMEAILWRLRRFRPRIIMGFTSSLFGLACHARDKGMPLDDLGVKLVMPISEMVQPFHRETLAQVFGAPVLMEYGCVEVGAMAYNCPSGRMHISHDHVIFEVLDESGNPVPEGSRGEVVLTPLFTRAMPLIRYRLGDLATLENEPCPCGRFPGLPSIQEIQGRTLDTIEDKQGKRWHAMVVYSTFKHVFDPTCFREVQGTQHEPGALRLLIVPGPVFQKEKADTFAAILQRNLNNQVAVSWETRSTIERERSGKLKYFKSFLAANSTESQPVPPRSPSFGPLGSSDPISRTDSPKSTASPG